MIDIQHSSLIWRFEAAGLEDNTIIGSSSIFSVRDLIYKNEKLLRISQEKIFPGGFKGSLSLHRSRHSNFKSGPITNSSLSSRRQDRNSYQPRSPGAPLLLQAENDPYTPSRWPRPWLMPVRRYSPAKRRQVFPRRFVRGVPHRKSLVFLICPVLYLQEY